MKSLKQRELRIDLSPLAWSVHDIGPDAAIYGPVDYGWQHYQNDPNVFTFGEGILATTPIHGARRLVFCAHSPLWETFYISSMGGAAFAFRHTGVNYVCLRGRAEKPSILLLNHDGKAPTVRLEAIEDFQALWSGYPAPDGSPLRGIYAVQQALLDRWGSEYPPKKVRAFVVGPASAVTPEGTIGSNPVEKGALNPVADWCGRGGMGSRLLQQHNIVGCLLGGQWEDPEATTVKDFDPYFVEHFGDRFVKIDKALTSKYSLDPKTGTGGTFGSNYHAMGDRILSFNYRSTYLPKAERLKQHKNFIVDHYLRQFNEETIATKSFEHCGEPCPVACKKMNGKFKKDYEPYHTLGPQVGVFDQRAAELLNDHADAMGFDAIQIGGMIAWIMECVSDGLIEPEAFGFPPRDRLRFDRVAVEGDEFDVVHDSMANARYAMAVIDALLTDPRAQPFRRGIRVAAREMNARYPSTRPGERAVFLSNGENGCMVPNQYFVPGMGSPMPIMGKYYVFYGNTVLPPEEVGRRNVERMVYELISDNLGMCRFHRQWVEPLANVLAREHFGLEIDFKRHHYELACQINAREGAKSVPWETGRIIDMLANYLRWVIEDGQQQAIAAWIDPERIHQALAPAAQGAQSVNPGDPAGASRLGTLARAFWEAIKRGQEEAFRAGHDALDDILTPAQQRAESADGP